MRILHYSLGFPPYRSGGMTQYAVDLMQAQRESGDDIAHLWPGRMPLLSRSPRFEQHSCVSGVASIEVVAPLPVPLREGIAKPRRFWVEHGSSVRTYFELIRRLRPDVVHVHTLMGLHREFLEAAKSARIPVVFTSHDYFGICPHVNLFYDGRKCSGPASGNCRACCSGGLSVPQVRLMQSRSYRALKDTAPVRAIRQAHRSGSEVGGIRQGDRHIGDSMHDYVDLLAFYRSMFALIDRFHFNSSQARDVFREHLEIGDYEVATITHGQVRDNRIVRACVDGVLHIAFLGAREEYKGFLVLTEALDELWTAGLTNFNLHVFGGVGSPKPYVIVHPKFSPEDRSKAMKDIGLVVVPSVCPETFGFPVIEAMSEGIPVVVSSCTGAADIVGSAFGFVVPPTARALYECLRAILLRNQLVTEFSQSICRSFRPKSMVDHVAEIRSLYGVEAG